MRGKEVKKETTFRLEWKTIFIDGDISFSKWITISNNMVINGDLTIWSNSTFLWSIKVNWDVKIWNHVYFRKILKWTNIDTGTYLRASQVNTKENLSFQWFAQITQWLLVGGNFESGSDMILHWNSKILWDVKLWADVFISGIFYVYGNMNGNYDFLFNWDKLRVIWNFKTQISSKLVGKIYMFARDGHRRLEWSTNTRYQYEVENTQYNWVMKKIDPILDYRLSQENIDIIHLNVIQFEKELKAQKKVIEQKYHSGKNEILINREIKKLIFIQAELFNYISQYIEKENWDIIQWKVLQIQEKRYIKQFIYQFISGIEFDY
jgi:carbonic anhydrase/acetyltransferase-like protein (isoleucine patch superfamily)